MLNLAYPITETVEINGEKYNLDMSFDNILRLFDLLEDKSLNDIEKVETGLLMLIDNKLDDYDIQEKAKIFIEIFKSAIGAEKEEQPVDLDGNPMPVASKENKKVYDLAQD